MAGLGRSLTVITLNRGSRSMWTSKANLFGQVESVRSSATVLATIGMPGPTSTQLSKVEVRAACKYAAIAALRLG